MNSIKLFEFFKKTAIRTNAPTPAPIREFTDLQVKRQFGRKNNQNFLFRNLIFPLICLRRTKRLKILKYTNSKRCLIKLIKPQPPLRKV